MKDPRTPEDFLIHLAECRIKEMQSTKEGLELFPKDNTMRSKYYVMGFVDGFTEGGFFKANKDKVKKKRIVTFE